MVGVLLAIVLLLTFAAIPRWNYSTRWGWAPSGTLAAVFLIAAIAFIVGWI